MCSMMASAATPVTGTLPDIVYRTLDSPLGPLLVAATGRGLVRLAVPVEDPAQVLAELASRLSPRMFDLPARLTAVARELDEYFAGRRRAFDLAIDWCLTGGFARRVLEAATRIPYGEVATYAKVAAEAGNPRAARAAGSALGANPMPIVVPCHRVVQSGGGLGGYRGGRGAKASLLELEAYVTAEARDHNGTGL